MRSTYTRGLSLVDVVVGTALMLVVFVALFGVFRASIALTASSKAIAGATSLATEQMEYVRSLTYANVGTIGGIPAGVVPQESVRILNGIEYTIRTFIQYIDDPADGIGADDENGITTDYKKIKVDVGYRVAGRDRTVSLVSNRTPAGIEAPEGGGTLFLQVYDADGLPVSFAQAHIRNPNTSPAIDLTTFTNLNGRVFLPGTPPAAGYRVTITKNGYSTTATYSEDAINVNPNPRHLTVSEAQTTQGTFFIDMLSSLLVRTWEPVQDDETQNTFSSLAGLSVSENISVNGGMLSLASSEGVYAASGNARSVAVAPEHLATWESFTATSTVPSGTSIKYRFYYGDGSVLVPDTVLPGNQSGISTTPVALNTLSGETYSTLYVEALLETNDTQNTPSIDVWSFAYQKGPTPLPSVSFSLTGTKDIGTRADGTTILKHEIDAATGPQGYNEILGLEWDSYSVAFTGYDVAEVCAPAPISITPNSTTTLDAYLVPSTPNSLRVVVRTAADEMVSDATVTIARSGYSATEVTSQCGQVYVGAMTQATDYTVTVSKAGFPTTSIQNVMVQGGSVLPVTLDIQ